MSYGHPGLNIPGGIGLIGPPPLIMPRPLMALPLKYTNYISQ